MTQEMDIAIAIICTILGWVLSVFFSVKISDKLEEYRSHRAEREKDDAVKAMFVNFVNKKTAMLKELNAERNFTEAEWATWFLNHSWKNFPRSYLKIVVYEWVKKHYPEVFRDEDNQKEA